MALRGKKQKPIIFIGCNLLSHIPGRAYPHHMMQMYRIGRELTKYDFMLNAPIQHSVDRMRNDTARMALEVGAEYIYFYDVDVLTPSKSLHKLLEAKKDIICANVYIRGYPYPPMIFKWKGKPRASALVNYKDYREKANKKGLVEVAAVGFSCALISCDLLRKMDPPYFVTGPRNTEDIYFCMKAAETVKNVKIFCDTNIKCGHLTDSYAVSEDNVEALKEFEEKVFGFTEEVESDDRGAEYLRECETLLPPKTLKVDGKTLIRAKR